MFRDSRLVLVVAVAVGLWVPLAHLEWFRGHEQASYILRTAEWAEELAIGELYPRWCPDFYGGYGSPLFMFYGPVIYGTAGLLTATFFDPFWALKLVVLGASVLSGVGAYLLIRGEARQRDAALLGAIAYLAAPYRIGNLYDRGDLGEFACIAVLPVVLALYRAAAREAQPRRARWLTAAASACHALLIMTHPVLGLWGSVVVGIVVAASALRLALNGVWRRALPLLGALACAPALAGVYIVPAMAYRGLGHTAGMVVGFYTPQDQWVALHTLFDGTSVLFARNFLQSGQLLVVASLTTAMGLVFNFRKGRWALGWMALSLALVGLTLPVASWLWAPGRIPLSQFIQFPWRLLGPAALTASVALGVGFAAASERLSLHLRNVVAISGAAAFLFIIAWPFVSTTEMPKDGIAAEPESIRQGVYSATDADEYLPLDIAAPPRGPKQRLVLVAKHAAVDFSFSDGSHHMLSIEALKPDATLRLAVYAFPGWHVATDWGPANATLDSERGLLRLHLPVPGAYRVKVSYGISPAGELGAVLSSLSALALCLFLIRGSRWWPSRIPALDQARAAS